MTNKNLKILVVDDEPVVCLSCERVLAPEGYTVVTTTDPEKGLEMAMEGAYGLILLDLKMANLDGFEFLTELRKRANTVPVVVITGYARGDNEAWAKQLGANDFLPKPFAPEELINALQHFAPKTSQ